MIFSLRKDKRMKLPQRLKDTKGHKVFIIKDLSFVLLGALVPLARTGRYVRPGWWQEKFFTLRSQKINKLKPAILFLLHFLFLQSAFGQKQMEMTKYISQKFLSYCESVPREEIFIHTDREEYIAGEDLWFNTYLVDRQSFNPSLISKIVYFELLNYENRPVVQKRLFIDKGFGPGQIVLPDTLSTGIYTIRAYTNWMKNFLPYNCFVKSINIYNAFSTSVIRKKVSKVDIIKGETTTQNDLSATDPGLTLKVDNFKPDILEIFISADANYRSQNSNLFYLFIQTHGKIDYVSTENISEGNTKISIPKTSITSGINHITIFDSKGQPVCERFIYTTTGNEDQFPILHSIDSCNTRSIISLEFEFKNKLHTTPDGSNLSISVAPKVNTSEKIDLNDFLIFGMDNCHRKLMAGKSRILFRRK
jgi:hypothetical protein